MKMTEIRIKFDEKRRQKVIIVFCHGNKEILIKSIENEGISLDKWIWD